MHPIQSGNSKKVHRLWTSGELEAKLQKLFYSKSTIFPGDSFYGKLIDKQNLQQLVNKIAEQLKISKPLEVHISTNIKEPEAVSTADGGHCIYFPAGLLARPFEAAAFLCHLLAHVCLNERGLIHADRLEHEELIDHTTIYAGLGIVVINGLHRSGWRYDIHRLLCRITGKPDTSQVLGYVSAESYIQKVKQLLGDDISDSNFMSVAPWERPKMYSKKNLKNGPLIMERARQRHIGSRLNFMALSLLLVFSALVTYASLSRKPAYLDSSDHHKQQHIKSLRATYDGCKLYLQQLQETMPDDMASDRVIATQQNRCKSLENQYNAAVQSRSQQ